MRLADEYDPLAPGIPQESWGISFTGAITGSAYADPAEFGTSNETPISMTFTASSGTIVNSINDGEIFLTQNYSFSAANVLQISESIQNFSGGTLAVEFQRDIDWDVYPTEFDEITTIPGVGTSGPTDLGAGIKVNLGTIPSGNTDTFSYYYAISNTGQTEAQLNTEVQSAGAAFVILTDSSDGPCDTCGTNSAAIGVNSAVSVIQTSFSGFESPDPSVSYFDTSPTGPGAAPGSPASPSSSTPTSTSTLPLAYLIAPPTTPTYVLPPVLDLTSSPAPPPSTGSTSGGTTGSVTTLDTGGTLFSSIAPGSGGGKPSEPIDDVVPIHPAPYKVPPPPTSDEAIGGFGSRLFQSHFTPIQHFGVSGIDTPAPSGGNPSLWYSAEFNPTP
jgi:hypothetical protein